jgi:hypothetical protein
MKAFSKSKQFVALGVLAFLVGVFLYGVVSA